jgi:hypothetical protein
MKLGTLLLEKARISRLMLLDKATLGAKSRVQRGRAVSKIR